MIEVELPDGTIAEFPDGTPPEVIKGALQRRFPRQPKAADDPSLWKDGEVPSIDPNDGAPAGTRFAAGAGKSVRDTGLGLVQFAASGGPAAAWMNAARDMQPQSVRDLIAGDRQRNPADVAGRVGDWADERVNANASADAALTGTAAGFTGNLAGSLAQMYSPAMLARGGSLAAGVLPRTLGGNVTQGVALGSVQAVQDGESRGINSLAGGIAGAAGHGVARGLEKWGARAADSISDEVRAVYEAAKARGIELTPAQLSDSRFIKGVQSMLRSMPFTGAQARHAEQVGQVNRAVAGTIGEDAPAVTTNVYAAAKARQSQQFNDLTARNDLRVDADLTRALSDVAEESKLAGDQVHSQVQAALDRLSRNLDGNTVPGRAYQSFDSALGKAMKSGGEGAHYLGQVRDAVREAMDRSISPADAEAWRTLRREYGNRKTLTPLVAAANDGPLPPAQLLRAVTNSKWGKEAMASGSRGELGTLAKIGQRLKEPPSSGTAERMMYGGVVNPVNWPGLAAGAAVGAPVSRALDSSALAKLLMRENPGLHRKAAGKYASALTKLLGLQTLPLVAAADEGG